MHRALPSLLLIAFSACVPLHVTTTVTTRVTDSSEERSRSEETSLRARARLSDAAASSMDKTRIEVLALNAHECMTRRVDMVITTTTTERRLERPLEPIIQLGVGSACAIASGLLLGLAPASVTDDVTGQDKPTVTGIFGSLFGGCAIGTVIPATVNLVRAIDSEDEKGPEEVFTEMPATACDSEPAAGVRVKIVLQGEGDEPPSVLAEGVTDEGGYVNLELPRDIVTMHTARMRIYADDIDTGPFELANAATIP